MDFNDVIITNAQLIKPQNKNEHKDYEYYKKVIIDGESVGGCSVSVYEVPPGKAAYPYHYHFQSIEVFYIISGTGNLRTPAGEKTVGAGDILAFPPNQSGAHKLTNSSQSEMLIYMDYDTYNSLEVSHLVDSGKLVIYGSGMNAVFKDNTQTNYYEGE